jgi:hypothetical protein
MAASVSYPISERFPRRRQVRHRSPRGAGRGRRQQQRQSCLGLGTLAPVRHPWRYHHGDCYRCALDEGAQSRADTARRARLKHVCALHHLHHRQYHLVPLGSAMIRVASLALGAPPTRCHPAGDRLTLCRRRLRDRQQSVRRWHGRGLRRHRLREGTQRPSGCRAGARHRHGQHGRTELITSLIKSDGNVLPFFSRPVAAVLAACTIAALKWPLPVWRSCAPPMAGNALLAWRASRTDHRN